MSLFKPATNMQACLKACFHGFPASGKTHTATLLNIGLHKHIKSKAPVFFLDTETGSDWMIPLFKDAGIPLEVARTRAFSDLNPAIEEAQKAGGQLIIDSLTHFWTELGDAYLKKMCQLYPKRRANPRLEFQDWRFLKAEWAKFTDLFLNSPVHITLCGRAGYEYEHTENDQGKKELIKSGVKMKAESEMGYEPSLLVFMERDMDMESKKVSRVAYVLKDRSRLLDGKNFSNPTFATFKPHIDFLNLGGQHQSLDTSRSTAIDAESDEGFRYAAQQKAIVLDEIETLLVEHYPSSKAEDKAAKIAALKEAFGTAAWERIKTFGLDALRAGFEHIREELEPDEPVTQRYETTPKTNGHPLAEDSIPEFPADTYPTVNFNEAGEEV